MFDNTKRVTFPSVAKVNSCKFPGTDLPIGVTFSLEGTISPQEGTISQQMKLRILSLIALLGVFSFVAAAADPSGPYKAEMQGRNGNTQSITINLKADGSNLTGSITTPRGDNPISDGKVDGDNVSFSQKMSLNGNDMVIKYKGKIEGDTIKFTRTMTTQDGQERKTEFAAKKQ